MTLSKFLTYWSLLFAILTIWGFSILVALLTAKDELLEASRRRRAAARARPAVLDPLATRSVAETLTPRPMTEPEQWVLEQVTPVAERLGIRARTIVIRDAHGHFVVHLAQDKRLVTYRLDKAWVTDARAGKAEQLDRIRQAVERYLRGEFLGETPAPAAAPAAQPGAAAAAAASGAAQPAGGASSAPGAAAGAPSREERIAAAKAKAEAIKAQRASQEGPDKPSGG